VFKPEIADTALADAQEEPDVGLAETVDRLHRIADHEQRPAVIRHPAAGQLFEQPDLARAGVLEFVDQQVADAVIERLRQIGRRLVIAQRQSGAGGDFDEIDLAGFLEGQPQLAGGQPQQAREAFDGGPLGIAQFRLRQAAEHGQRRLEPGTPRRSASKALIASFCGEFFVGRKADVLVTVLRSVPVPVSSSVAKACQRGRSSIAAVSGKFQSKSGSSGFRHIGRSKAGQRHQQRLPAVHQAACRRRQIALDQRRETGLDLGLHRPAFDPRRVVQPLVAAAEHGDQQAFQPAGVVVHEGQRRRHLGIGVRPLRPFPACAGPPSRNAPRHPR
jgi:hypothetical protein